MADSNFSYYRDESINARHQVERKKMSKPSKPGNNGQFNPKGLPLETPEQFQAMMQLGRQNPNHDPAWPSLDYLFEENARLQSESRSHTRSMEKRASDKAKRDALRAQLERVKKMDVSKRSVGTMTEETDQEKRMSPPSNISADPELPSRSKSVTSSADGLVSPLIQPSAGMANPPSASNRSSSALSSYIVRVSDFKDNNGQAESGNACAKQAKKRLSGRSLKEVAKGVLKGVTRKLGSRGDASK